MRRRAEFRVYGNGFFLSLGEDSEIRASGSPAVGRRLLSFIYDDHPTLWGDRRPVVIRRTGEWVGVEDGNRTAFTGPWSLFQSLFPELAAYLETTPGVWRDEV